MQKISNTLGSSSDAVFATTGINTSLPTSIAVLSEKLPTPYGVVFTGAFIVFVLAAPK
jgi:hypothetical protein